MKRREREKMIIMNKCIYYLFIFRNRYKREGEIIYIENKTIFRIYAELNKN